MSADTTKDFRLESDSIGSHQVPKDAYYGVQSMRAQENFPITGHRLHPAFIKSLAYMKKGSALTNGKFDQVDQKIVDAMVQACDEIIAGQWHDQFIVDPIQGGAGTSMNMNANEVIANRAIEILGGEKGDYSIVHPNDHVNYGQSTNDVIPSAGKLTIIHLYQGLRKEMLRLQKALEAKADEFHPIIKMGRTQLQDAIPIRLGQEFHAYAVAVERNLNRLDQAILEMETINMGATAIGTGLNADINYFENVVPCIAELTAIPFKQAEDLIDGTQHIDSFSHFSSALKTLGLSLSKIANDLRLMSSGPRTGINEINLPKKQNGSSIMPGKVNPVIPEMISQVAFRVAGNDTTVSMAVEAGQFELNAFEPIVFYAIFESIHILEKGIASFIDHCIEGITANAEHCQDLVENSVGIITALVPYLGYQKSAEIAKKAMTSNQPVRTLVLEEDLMTEDLLNKLLSPEEMTSPGIRK